METNECKHQYPRTMENKVRVCVLCGHAEETNELPEEVKNGSQIGIFKYAYNLALQSKEEQLKAKDEEIARWKNRQEILEENISGLMDTVDSLTSEVERLKKERESRAEHKRLNDEIAQLTKPKDELTKEVERLRELLGKAKLVIENGNDWSERNEEEANKLYTEICDLLSQSTDKQP